MILDYFPATFVPYDGTLDPRLDWTVGRRGIPYLDWGLHPGYDWIREQSSGGPYSPKKTSIYVSQIGTYTDASFWTIGANAININLIRYADVLLWAAEVEVMSANGSLAKAQDYVNQVRTRAADPAGWVHKYVDAKILRRDLRIHRQPIIISDYIPAFGQILILP